MTDTNTGNSDLDLINSLGLGGDTAPTSPSIDPVTGGAVAATTEDAEAATKPERAKRTEIKITGTIATGVSAMLPEKVAFGGGRGERESKYPFESLAAPTKDEAGNVTGYAFFEVKLTDVENADAAKLKGAVQAAVAAQNKKHKEAGETTKYVSRAVIENGAYAGTSVYRVDDTIKDEDEAK